MKQYPHSTSEDLHSSVEMAIKKLMDKGLSENAINKLRNETGYGPRNRKATAYRLSISVIAAYFGGVVGSFAGIQAYFMAFFGTIRRRAFQLRFKSEEASIFFSALFTRLTSSVISPLAVPARGLLNVYTEVIAFDGTKIYMPPRAQDIFPGYNRGTSGMRLLVSYFLSTGCVKDFSIGAETDHDMTLFKLLNGVFPQGSLLIADLGFFGQYIFELAKEKCCDVLLRLKSNVKPTIVQVVVGKGGKKAKGKNLQDWMGKRYRGTYIDVDVTWRKMSLRVVGFWVKRPKGKSSYRFYLTNAPREKVDAPTLVRAYRIRWNIELLFKEEKQSVGLSTCFTGDEHASLALFFGALCGHVLLRSLRVMLANLCEIKLALLRPYEFRRKCRVRLKDLVSSLQDGTEAIIEFLSNLIEECRLASRDAIPSKAKPLIPESLGVLGA